MSVLWFDVECFQNHYVLPARHCDSPVFRTCKRGNRSGGPARHNDFHRFCVMPSCTVRLRAQCLHASHVVCGLPNSVVPRELPALPPFSPMLSAAGLAERWELGAAGLLCGGQLTAKSPLLPYFFCEIPYTSYTTNGKYQWMQVVSGVGWCVGWVETCRIILHKAVFCLAKCGGTG